MKKDKKWLKEAIGDLDYTKAMFVYDGDSYIDTAVSVMQVYDLIDELDEPEILSKEWIDNNSINASHDGVTDEYVHIDDLKNLLVTKQELPVIPKYVADWLDDNTEKYRSVYSFIVSVVETFGDTIPEEVRFYAGENSDMMARAYLDGYTVAEEEPLYCALIKGRHLIYGGDPLKYWNFDSRNNRLFVGTCGVGYGMHINEMSKSEWNELGINESNADFIRVEEEE